MPATPIWQRSVKAALDENQSGKAARKAAVASQKTNFTDALGTASLYVDATPLLQSMETLSWHGLSNCRPSRVWIERSWIKESDPLKSLLGQKRLG